MYVAQSCLSTVLVCATFALLDRHAVPQEASDPQPVSHVVNVRIDHKKKVLEGDCTVVFRGTVTEHDKKVSFQFLDGQIEKVLVDDEPVKNYLYGSYPGLTEQQTKEYDLKQLEVTIPAKIASKERFSMRLVYRDDEFYATAINLEDNKPFSLGQIGESEAFSSHINYYPFLQNAGLKGEIYISTNLSGAVTISSGKLESSEPIADGFTRFHYHTEHGSGLLPYPFAIGKYDLLEGIASDGRSRIQIYSLPADKAFAEQKMPIVQDVFKVFVDLFGEYPFPKLAIVETDLKEGNIGLAAQSVIMLSSKVWFAGALDPKKTDLSNSPLYVLADEINHQWNAYKVGSPNYLAEGISRYVDSLYGERLGGLETLRSHMQQTADSYFYLIEKSGVEDKAVSDPTVTPVLYFIKGAMALHMLRKMLGYESFKKGMKSYFTDNAGKTTTLTDFRSAFEKTSGKRLEWFFTQWYEKPGWPKLSVRWESVSSSDADRVSVTINQKGPAFFRLEGFPLRVKYGNQKTEDLDLMIEAKDSQTITVKVAGKPKDLEFDPEGWFLKQIEVTK